MTPLYSLFVLLMLCCLELIYFKIAAHFNIIDHPNERSSHQAITLRGGGIIFALAGIIFFLFSGFQYPYFILGLCAIATVSFLDDVVTLKNKIRISIHLIAVLLLFHQLDLFVLPWYWLILTLIVVIGTINAYNFMDGINGITGGYCFISILTLYYINNYVVNFTANDLLIIIGLSLLVFNFFNFRKKAKCFAGDVGSVSIAFILIFLIGQLIVTTNNLAYILLTLLYGLDTVTTIIFRILRKENIFKAHRSHFYQYLANQLKMNQLIVTALYMATQLLINLVLILLIQKDFTLAVLFSLGSAIVFLGLRFTIEGKSYLLHRVGE